MSFMVVHHAKPEAVTAGGIGTSSMSPPRPWTSATVCAHWATSGSLLCAYSRLKFFDDMMAWFITPSSWKCLILCS